MVVTSMEMMSPSSTGNRGRPTAAPGEVCPMDAPWMFSRETSVRYQGPRMSHKSHACNGGSGLHFPMPGLPLVPVTDDHHVARFNLAALDGVTVASSCSQTPLQALPCLHLGPRRTFHNCESVVVASLRWQCLSCLTVRILHRRMTSGFFC